MKIEEVTGSDILANADKTLQMRSKQLKRQKTALNVRKKQAALDKAQQQAAKAIQPAKQS